MSRWNKSPDRKPWGLHSLPGNRWRLGLWELGLTPRVGRQGRQTAGICPEPREPPGKGGAWAGKMMRGCFLTLGAIPCGQRPKVFPRSSLAGEELGLHCGLCWPRRPRSLLGHAGGFPCPPLWHLPPWSSAHSPCSPSQHRVSGGLA